MALHKPKQLYVLGKLRFSSIKPMKMIEICCVDHLACNFKVNLITYLEVVALFSSNFKNVNTFHPLFQKL
jgi:hypothetical protein